MSGIPEPDEFRAAARRWLTGVARPRAADGEWGSGSDSVAVFDNWTEEQEREHTARVQEWERTRYDHGWSAFNWPREYGGRGLPAYY
ncbi:acyl-CoA dehydrogenase family protein, partial [Streptomyces albiflaviniger]|nr:acyl-CoA dehydrogenase family protein [Streptomyces albiflaviniger]